MDGVSETNHVLAVFFFFNLTTEWEKFPRNFFLSHTFKCSLYIRDLESVHSQ